MTRVLRSTAAALLAGVTLAACGGEQGGTAAPGAADGDAAHPGAVVKRYLAALGSGQGRAACELLTDAGRQVVMELPRGERAGSCEEAVAELASDLVPVRRPRVQDLRVSGGTATAQVTSDDPPYDSGVLLRMDGGWKIAYPPAVLSRFDTPPGIRPHEEDEHDRGSRG